VCHTNWGLQQVLDLFNPLSKVNNLQIIKSLHRSLFTLGFFSLCLSGRGESAVAAWEKKEESARRRTCPPVPLSPVPCPAAVLKYVRNKKKGGNGGAGGAGAGGAGESGLDQLKSLASNPALSFTLLESPSPPLSLPCVSRVVSFRHGRWPAFTFVIWAKQTSPEISEEEKKKKGFNKNRREQGDQLPAPKT